MFVAPTLFSSCGRRGSPAFLGSAGLDVLVTHKLPFRMATSAGVRRCQQAARFGPAWAAQLPETRRSGLAFRGWQPLLAPALPCPRRESQQMAVVQKTTPLLALQPFAWSTQALHSTTSQPRILGLYP